MGEVTVSTDDAILTALKETQRGIIKLLEIQEIRQTLNEEHIANTPTRFCAALQELLSGWRQDPEEILKNGSFNEGAYDEMIIIKDIDFVSLCAHHLLPFIGKVHFGYIPGKKIVGLSKIPRLVEALARRPQIQEHLSVQIVDTFEEVIEPRGCGVVIEATHLCMTIRGVRKPGAITNTTALRGIFKNYEATHHEFLNKVGK
jgi:GTP cyclohydrolase IA